MSKTETFEFNGHQATVIIPEHPNGKWIWKTEFLYAFDKAEQTLLEMGYTRVYYAISDMFGSYNSVRLMHKFHKFVVEKYNLELKPCMFGFSRGGLYAFNYANTYPEYVAKLYLDAPVLNLKTWPLSVPDEKQKFFKEYCLNDESIGAFCGSPLDRIAEFADYNIPVLIVAGDVDSVVPFAENSKKMIEYYETNGKTIRYIVKKGCDHHPHSLDDVTPIIEFITK